MVRGYSVFKSIPPYIFLVLCRNLADTQDRGVLDAVDFTIGMYFIQGVMSGTISLIPTVLPPSLYQQAGGVAPTPSVKSHTTGTSGSFSPVRGNFRPQPTGQIPLQPQTTGFPAPMFAPALPARPGTTQTNGLSAEWDVTPAEKASSDRYFGFLDAQKRGYIDGDIAVPFMLKSQLPGEVLAQVWYATLGDNLSLICLLFVVKGPC
jgi:epidermal growth factor receptor substrate 15